LTVLETLRERQAVVLKVEVGLYASSRAPLVPVLVMVFRGFPLTISSSKRRVSSVSHCHSAMPRPPLPLVSPVLLQLGSARPQLHKL
jgi:hypothetical protein